MAISSTPLAMFSSHYGQGCSEEPDAARVCREAGGRVIPNLFVRDMDLGVSNVDENWRLEVVVDGVAFLRRRAVRCRHDVGFGIQGRR